MSTFAADEYATIRDNLQRIRAQELDAKRKCKAGCGAALGGYHRVPCTYSGLVAGWEADDAV